MWADQAAGQVMLRHGFVIAVARQLQAGVDAARAFFVAAFVGDALYKGGNDAPVKKTGVDYIQESGPGETIEFLRGYL